MIGTVQDGRYRILARLGAGGMGEVYLAEHINLGRREAIKILHAKLAAEPTFVARFRREARATNRLQHPNIVSVYDFGQLSDGRFFLTIEYAEGERLDKVIERGGPLPVARALHLLAQLADAVDHAHSRGVVHRDLKPENLVLTQHRGHADFVKVLDFGIAKIIAPEDQQSLEGSTGKGEVFGTPSYMAPEQFGGDGREPRSDIYAVGCIAFELLTGQPPFTGRPIDLVQAHMTKPPEPPSSRRARGEISRQLDDLVLRCLEKDPTRRFPTGRELQHALEQVPGFRRDRDRGGAGGGLRRSRTSVPALLALTAAVPSDFESSDTRPGAHDFDPIDTDAEGGLTVALNVDEALAALHATLRLLVESILDHGQADYQLIVGAAQLKELEEELERNEAELAAIEQRTSGVEQAAREREGALRFALGELRFERGKVLERGETVDPGLEQQIAVLAQRLAAVSEQLDGELERMSEQAMALTVGMGGHREELEALYGSLGRLLEEIAPRYTGHATVGPLLARWRTAVDMLHHTRAPRRG